MSFTIIDWDVHFENSQSKRWDNIRWVPIPNKQGIGYKKIMQQKNGAEIFGCWIAIVECASRQKPRGIINMSIEDLSLETMINNVTLLKSIEFLCKLSWLIVDSEQTLSVPTPQNTSPTDQRSILFNSIPCSSILSSWRDSFEVYRKLVLDAMEFLLTDKIEFEKLQKFNPTLDIKLSLEKSVENFWGTEAGWKNKRKTKSKDIDMVMTLKNNLDKSKVYLAKGTNNGNSNTSTTVRSIASEYDGF